MISSLRKSTYSIGMRGSEVPYLESEGTGSWGQDKMPPLWGSYRRVGRLQPRWRPSKAGMPENLISHLKDSIQELYRVLPRCRPSGAGMPGNCLATVGSVCKTLFFSEPSEPRRGVILVESAKPMIIGAPAGRHLSLRLPSFPTGYFNIEC